MVIGRPRFVAGFFLCGGRARRGVLRLIRPSIGRGKWNGAGFAQALGEEKETKYVSPKRRKNEVINKNVSLVFNKIIVYKLLNYVCGQRMFFGLVSGD